MGTRMLASQESGVHANVKQAVVDASEVDTMMFNRSIGRPMRVLRTPTSSDADGSDARVLLARILETYDDGDIGASLAQLGQVTGRVVEVLPVAEILRRTVAEFDEHLERLARLHLVSASRV